MADWSPGRQAGWLADVRKSVVRPLVGLRSHPLVESLCMFAQDPLPTRRDDHDDDEDDADLVAERRRV